MKVPRYKKKIQKSKFQTNAIQKLKNGSKKQISAFAMREMINQECNGDGGPSEIKEESEDNIKTKNIKIEIKKKSKKRKLRQEESEDEEEINDEEESNDEEVIPEDDEEEVEEAEEEIEDTNGAMKDEVPHSSNTNITNKKIEKKKLKSALKAKKIKGKEAFTTSHDEKEEKKNKKKNKGEVSKQYMKVMDMESGVSSVSEPADGDSRELARRTFSWLIHPVDVKHFTSEVWEKKPLLVKRRNNKYYKHIFSTKEFDKILREDRVFFTKNLDITSYSNGERETHNPDGQAYPHVVWDYYGNGCSLRFLNPQTFSHGVWKLLQTLQEHFNSFTGANVYLTPAGTQGFAPHWDDIDAFMLQLEGEKHWKIYAPPPSDKLPLVSSKNFSQDEIGEPLLEAVLQPGDVLYLPRGFIHQGSTKEEHHSLHITISAHQKHTWGDLLKHVLPDALQRAMTEDEEFRHSLPLDYTEHVGIVNDSKDTAGRTEFINTVNRLVEKVAAYMQVDTGADVIAKQVIHDSLPPLLTPEEQECTVFGSGERWANTGTRDRVELEPDTKVRLIRAGAVRLTLAEGDGIRMYYNVQNSRQYREDELQYIELKEDQASVCEQLILSYPQYTAIDELSAIDDVTDKVSLVGDLWERGILMTSEPLPIVE